MDPALPRAERLFAWLLLRRRAPGPLALWCGVALLAFPPTLANRFIHANLMAHWTILAALWLFLQPERGRQLRWWAPLIAVTALIHSYLLVMVGAIWASAMLRAAWRGRVARPLAVAGQVAAILCWSLLLALWLGVGGDYAAAGQLRRLRDAARRALEPRQRQLFQRPARDRTSGRGAGFEGFQYLGLGGLLLIAAALVAWREAPAARDEARSHPARVALAACRRSSR